MSKRTCDVPGCDRPHRAKGMCSTHYNQRVPRESRHPRISSVCAVCGAPITRTPDKRFPARVCSVACRTTLVGGTPRSVVPWEGDAERRARRAGAVRVDRVVRDEVLRRDDYTCWICGCSVDMDVDPLHPAAPSMDHVVPLASGGEHTYSNIRTSHYGCNSARRGIAQGA